MATAAADQARAVQAKIEHRAADLRRELDQVYAALTQVNNNAAEARRLAERDLSASRQMAEQLLRQMAAQEATWQSQLTGEK